MDEKPSLRDEAYLKYLQSKVQDDSVDLRPNPTARPFGAKPAQPPTSRISLPLVACGFVVLVLLLLIVRGVLFHQTGPTVDSGTLDQLETDAKDWSWSSVKGIVGVRLANHGSLEFPPDTVELEHVDGNRWRSRGAAIATKETENEVEGEDPVVSTHHAQWEMEFEYQAATKSGDIHAVHLDGEMIYAK